jgi:hypothetical protein
LTVSEVPFLKKEVIEADALSLLTEYGQVSAPPIPIDDIRRVAPEAHL